MLYVDDMLIVSHDKSAIIDLKAYSTASLRWKIWVQLRRFLGWTFEEIKMPVNCFSINTVILRKFCSDSIWKIANRSTLLSLHILNYLLIFHRRQVKILNTCFMYQILVQLGVHVTWQEGTPIQSHLDEFNTVLIDLEHLDIKDKVILPVYSLPSYRHFKEITLYNNNETLSFEDVKSHLLSKEKYDK